MPLKSEAVFFSLSFSSWLKFVQFRRGRLTAHAGEKGMRGVQPPHQGWRRWHRSWKVRSLCRYYASFALVRPAKYTPPLPSLIFLAVAVVLGRLETTQMGYVDSLLNGARLELHLTSSSLFPSENVFPQ